MVMETVSSAD